MGCLVGLLVVAVLAASALAQGSRFDVERPLPRLLGEGASWITFSPERTAEGRAPAGLRLLRSLGLSIESRAMGSRVKLDGRMLQISGDYTLKEQFGDLWIDQRAYQITLRGGFEW